MFKRTSILLGTLLAATFVGSARAEQPEGAGSAKGLTVMTQNVYVGADLTPAIAAILSGDPSQIPPAVSQVWANVQATDFPTRISAPPPPCHSPRPRGCRLTPFPPSVAGTIGLWRSTLGAILSPDFDARPKPPISLRLVRRQGGFSCARCC